ncbi:NAD-dependent succinate-semialdehyde dehydrogenase [Alkaliphilus serpentinus]|uniref:NAD-dependent succinate-semialdehyde dehydrogenase n=1 Tax=Alkaliphilus serpentinus TaxID=1482731 RepID=A0A833HNG8_9FIRM|nr:NAD-dependent succinate-semialdehyde dehydrogenase [Alkaliphilus serpentinus]KAB3528818.1 NAD-dependent succinate-semialdehyde dehydrogenase [Alkaliphilus serpentinus]
MKNNKMYINGCWVEAKNGKGIEVHNPATGELLGTVPMGGGTETKEAIDAADGAFKEWSQLPASARGSLLRKLYDLVMEEKEEIARIMTLEQGKPLKEAVGECIYGANFLEWYAEEAKRVYGETIPASSKEKRIMVLKQPIGVVAAVTPWNFPLAMITRKLAPALAAGCTVVLKPASQTPLTAIKFMELVEAAGFPPGVVNMVTGVSSQIGAALMEDERVKKLTFTGSTEVGKQLMKQSADTVKKVSLELGGHAPFIVFEDADIDKAVDGAVASKFRNCGQTCISSNRFYVHENILDAFLRKLVERIKDLKLGNGLVEGVEIGPLIDSNSFEKVQKHVEDALDKGGKLVYGGKGQHLGINKKGGYFMEPTVIASATGDMIIAKEETFGPIMPIISFNSEEEVIKMANNSSYGLAAYFFTQSLSRSIRVMEALEYGIIGVNDGRPSTPQAPFGGFKESGIGREGGHYGIEEFLEIKFVSIEI